MPSLPGYGDYATMGPAARAYLDGDPRDYAPDVECRLCGAPVPEPEAVRLDGADTLVPEGGRLIEYGHLDACPECACAVADVEDRAGWLAEMGEGAPVAPPDLSAEYGRAYAPRPAGVAPALPVAA